MPVSRIARITRAAVIAAVMVMPVAVATPVLAARGGQSGTSCPSSHGGGGSPMRPVNGSWS